jgi:hypothetical protein
MLVCQEQLRHAFLRGCYKHQSRVRGPLVPCIRLNQAGGMQADRVRLPGPGIGPGSDHEASSSQPGSGETAESAVFSEPGCACAAV